MFVLVKVVSCKVHRRVEFRDSGIHNIDCFLLVSLSRVCTGSRCNTCRDFRPRAPAPPALHNPLHVTVSCQLTAVPRALTDVRLRERSAQCPESVSQTDTHTPSSRVVVVLPDTTCGTAHLGGKGEDIQGTMGKCPFIASVSAERDDTALVLSASCPAHGAWQYAAAAGPSGGPCAASQQEYSHGPRRARV